MQHVVASLLFLGACITAVSAADQPTAAQSPWRRHVIDNASRGADGVRLADADGDGAVDVVTGWEQGGSVRLCLNPGAKKCRDAWPSVTVGRAGNVEDAVLADLDNDGRLDVVSCSEGKTRSIQIHWGPDRSKILDPAAWTTMPLPEADSKMMWMFALPLQIDERDGVDLVAGGKNRDAALGWFQSPANARDLSGWRWHELRKVGWLMSLVSSDMDGDGDQDIVFSDRKGGRSGAAWLENPGKARATAAWQEHPIGGQGMAAMFLSLSDLDADGLEDVLLAVQPKEIRWMRRLTRDGRQWESISIPLPEPTGVAKAVSAGDIDLDGRLELVFSCEKAVAPGEGLMWLKHEGPVTAAPTQWRWTPHRVSGVDGVKHDLVALVDLDADGDLDAMTTEEVQNLGVIWYENPLR